MTPRIVTYLAMAVPVMCLAHGTEAVTGDVIYSQISDSTAEARCVNMAAESVVIDDSVAIDGHICAVTRIAYQGFMDCTELTGVRIPDTVTEIGDFAFQNCRSLSLPVMSQSLVSIGDEAFKDCYSLKYIKLPKGLRSIGDFAFWGCDELIKAYIPNSVENIEYGAFNSCEKAEIVIDNSRYDIKVGEGAFRGVKSVSYLR